MTTIAAVLALAQYAPSVLRFFGAGEKPVAVADKVLSIAQAVTGTKTPEEATAALAQNAELAQQFNLAVIAADEELEKAALADIQDARRRDLEVRRQSGGSNSRANWMIVGDVVGLLSCLIAMVYITWLGVGADGNEAQPIVMAINGPLGMLTQQFANGLRDAHQFEFGSSRGSKEKDELLLTKR